MWNAESLVRKLSYRGNEEMHIFEYNSFSRNYKIFPFESINDMYPGNVRRRKALSKTQTVYDLIQFNVFRNTEIVEPFFNSIAFNRESILNVSVRPVLLNSDKLDEWVKAYEKFSEYHEEAKNMKRFVERIKFENVIKGLKESLSNVVDTMNNFVLFYPSKKFLKKSDAWFTILAIASLDTTTFERMKDKTLDVWDTLDFKSAIQKYGTNVTYILIDDIAWSGGQASQLAYSICNYLRVVRYDTSELQNIDLFKAKLYRVPPKSVVIIRAGAAKKAVQVFKDLSNDSETKDTISFEYAFELNNSPTSSLFTWCSNNMFQSKGGVSSSYGYADHKIPDYSSTAVIMPFLTGIVCPYMFHGAQVQNEGSNTWKILQDKFDIFGKIVKEELLYTWKTANEYKLTLDNGLVIFSASPQLNKYKFRPFLKNNMSIRIEQVTDNYIFAFSDTACVLMSKGELWSDNELHEINDNDPIVIDPNRVSWNEGLWEGEKSSVAVFQLNFNGNEYIGRNCVEDKVQSSYIQGILPYLNMQQIDPNGVIPAFALCHIFSANFTWGRPKSFYKGEEIQMILKKVVMNISGGS